MSESSLGVRQRLAWVLVVVFKNFARGLSQELLTIRGALTTTMSCASSLVVSGLGGEGRLLSGLFSALPLVLVVVFVILLTVVGKSFLPPEALKRYGDCIRLRRWRENLVLSIICSSFSRETGLRCVVGELR